MAKELGRLDIINQMIDIETLTSLIKRNCNISDARFWGTYSVCGLLLRLRELYRIEKGIRPWERIEQKEIGEWIGERENLWKELEDKDYTDIIVGGNVYNPFEVEKINEILEKKGLIYGAGYGLRMKPSFFLGELISKKTIEGYDVYIIGDEFVRDLSDYPAMLQGRVIFARLDVLKLLLWGKFDELRLRGPKGTLAFAFSRYGISPEDEPSEDIDRRISLIACDEIEAYIRHEIGEAFEGERLGDKWKRLLTGLLHPKAEFFVRSIKDLLSDSSEKGMIKYIIENQKESTLGFYITSLGGYRRVLFPEILSAFERFTETKDWGLIDDARRIGYKKAERYAEKLLSAYKNRALIDEIISELPLKNPI